MPIETIHDGPRFRVRHFPRSRLTLVEDREDVLHIYHDKEALEIADAVRTLRRILADGDCETLLTYRADALLSEAVGQEMRTQVFP